MKYTPQMVPAPRHWSWEETAVLRDADAIVMAQILASSEGDFRQWIHSNSKQAAELLIACIDQYHQAIEKFLSTN